MGITPNIPLFVDTSTTCCDNVAMSEDTTKITRLQRKLFPSPPPTRKIRAVVKLPRS